MLSFYAWVFWQLVAFSATCFSFKTDTSEVDSFSRWNQALDLSIDAWSWKARPLCYFSLISFSSRRNLWKCSRFPTSHSQEPKFLCGQKWPSAGRRNVELTMGFWPKMPFINFWLKKRVPPIHFLRVFSLKFILKQNHWVPRSSHIRMFVQELRITHSDQKCLSLASGWKKRVPPIHFLRVFSLKFILKQNHWVPRSSHIRMFVQELRITHSDKKCLSLTSGWKKGYPLSTFEGVFIEIHFEAKPLSAKKLPYQDVRSRASHHPFWPKMPFISFWLKKRVPPIHFWGCFHWNSFWSKTIECQEAPISGCSFKSFASLILTKNAFH